MTTIVRGEDQQESGPINRSSSVRPRICTPPTLPLRLPLHLRSRGTPVLLDRRARRHAARAGPVESDRQDPSRERRWVGAERQSLRGDTRRGPDDLELRPSQSRRACPGIRGPDGSGSPRTARTAGDEINIIERGRNYGWGVVPWGAAGITKASEPGMTTRSSTTSRRSRRPVSRSTPAICIQAGRTTCSSAAWPARRCGGWRLTATR